jgi:hypothetical protein
MKFFSTIALALVAVALLVSTADAGRRDCGCRGHRGHHHHHHGCCN